MVLPLVEAQEAAHVELLVAAWLRADQLGVAVLRPAMIPQVALLCTCVVAASHSTLEAQPLVHHPCVLPESILAHELLVTAWLLADQLGVSVRVC